MGKKRPFFEYKGFQGFLDAFNGGAPSGTHSLYRYPPSSETPRPPHSYRSYRDKNNRQHRPNHRRRNYQDSLVVARKRDYGRRASTRRHSLNPHDRRRAHRSSHLDYNQTEKDYPRRALPRRRPRVADHGDFPAGLGASKRLADDSADRAPLGYDAYDVAARTVDPDFSKKYAQDVETGRLPGARHSPDPDIQDEVSHFRRAHSEDGRSRHTASIRRGRADLDSYDGTSPPRRRRHTHNGSSKARRSRKRSGIFSFFGGGKSETASSYSAGGSPRYSKPYTEAHGRKKKRHGIVRAGAAIAAIVALVIAGRRLQRWWRQNGQEEDEKSDGGSGDAAENHEQEDEKLIANERKPVGVRTSMYGPLVKVPQNEAAIVEQGGKFKRKLAPGNNFLVPGLERVAYTHSLREAPVPIEPQQCFSRDNISVIADALMFIRVEDPVSASYEVHDLLHSMVMLAIATLKKEIGRLSIDELFLDRVGASDRIARMINQASRPWGVRCTRFDLQDLGIPEEVRMSIGRAAEAERLRRADILFSEGQREALINKAEGEMQAQIRMSQARQMDIVNQAIGEAHAIQERGEAIANAMRDIAEAVKEPGGEQAMRLRLAEQYLNACAVAKEAGKDGVAYDPANVAAAMTHAIGLLSALGDPSPNVANPYIVRPATGHGVDAPATTGDHDSDERDNEAEAYNYDEVNGYDKDPHADSVVDERPNELHGQTNGGLTSRNSSPAEGSYLKPHVHDYDHQQPSMTPTPRRGHANTGGFGDRL